MTTATPTPTTLASRMSAVMAAIDAVTKRGENTQQGYGYVKATDVAREVRAELVRAGVAFTLGITSAETVAYERQGKTPLLLTTVLGEATFIDTVTGETLVVPVAGSGSDYLGDKGLYKAITGAIKYALRATFLIPDENDPEQDQRDDQPAGDTGATVTVVGGELTTRQKNALRGQGRDLGIVDDAWKAFVHSVTGKASSKDLNASDFETLMFILQNDTPEKQAAIKPYAAGGLLEGATVASSAATVA